MSKYSSIALIGFLLVALVQAVPEGRIVGGNSAIAGQLPYAVSLKFKGEHKCGGTIISKNYILTAAHCVVDRANGYVKRAISLLAVQAGTTHREKGGVLVPVAETMVHPEYDAGDKTADIALVRLAKPLAFSKIVKAIELSSDDVPENTPVVISGWGHLSRDGTKPSQLQWTTLQSLSKRSCTLAMRRNSDYLLCLGHPKDKGACTGDSGGPAVVADRLVGVASFIRGECGSDRPDAYVKVSHFFGWIVSHSDV